MKRIAIFILTVACMLNCLAVGSFAATPEPQSSPASGGVKTLNFTAGKTYQFKNHADNVTYSSSDTSIVSVDALGKITAHKPGSCTLTRTANGKEKTYPVLVSNTSSNAPIVSENVSASAKDFKLINIGGYAFSSGAEIKIDLTFDDNNTVMVLCTQSEYSKGGIAELVNNDILPLPMPSVDVNDIGIERVAPMIFTVSNTGVLQNTLAIDDAGQYNIYLITYDNIKELTGTVSLPDGTTVEVNL